MDHDAVLRRPLVLHNRRDLLRDNEDASFPTASSQPHLAMCAFLSAFVYRITHLCNNGLPCGPFS